MCPQRTVLFCLALFGGTAPAANRSHAQTTENLTDSQNREASPSMEKLSAKPAPASNSQPTANNPSRAKAKTKSRQTHAPTAIFEPAPVTPLFAPEKPANPAAGLSAEEKKKAEIEALGREIRDRQRQVDLLMRLYVTDERKYLLNMPYGAPPALGERGISQVSFEITEKRFSDGREENWRSPRTERRGRREETQKAGIKASATKRRVAEFGRLSLDGAVFEQILQLRHEFLDILKIHVHAGKAHIGNFVELLEAMHNHLADFGGGQLPFRGFVDHAFDFVNDAFKFWCGHGTLFASFQQTLQDFLAFEALAAAIFFDDHVGNLIDALVSGKAAGAFQAFAATTNGVAGAALAGIDDLVVKMSTERTLHSGILLMLGAYYSSGCKKSESDTSRKAVIRDPSRERSGERREEKSSHAARGRFGDFGVNLFVFVGAHAFQFADGPAFAK